MAVFFVVFSSRISNILVIFTYAKGKDVILAFKNSNRRRQRLKRWEPTTAKCKALLCLVFCAACKKVNSINVE